MDVTTYLSLGRTALIEPGTLDKTTVIEALENVPEWYTPSYNPEDVAERHGPAVLFAVDMFDSAIQSLDVELRPATALETTGKIQREVAELLEIEIINESPERNAERREIAAQIHAALDLLDPAISQLAEMTVGHEEV